MTNKPVEVVSELLLMLHQSPNDEGQAFPLLVKLQEFIKAHEEGQGFAVETEGLEEKQHGLSFIPRLDDSMAARLFPSGNLIREEGNGREDDGDEVESDQNQESNRRRGEERKDAGHEKEDEVRERRNSSHGERVPAGHWEELRKQAAESCCHEMKRRIMEREKGGHGR